MMPRKQSVSNMARAAEDRFAQFLRYLGYGDESIVRDFPVGRQHVDFAVVDPNTGQPLMLFEVKTGESRQVLVQAKHRLSAARRALDPLQVGMYAVRVIPEMGGVQVWEVSESGERLVNTDIPRPASPPAGVPMSPSETGLPSLAAARADVKRRTVSRFLTKIRGAVDALTVASWALAMGTGVLFWLDVTRRFQLDARQLSLLGVLLFLILAPFASKLKVLGVEFERFQRTAKQIATTQTDASSEASPVREG